MNQMPYSSPIGYHRHRCDKCNHIWEHCNEMRGDQKAHECPKCGTEQWVQYRGDAKPCVTQSCQSIIPRSSLIIRPEELSVWDLLDFSLRT